MKLINKTMWLADFGKIFIKKSDGSRIGTIINIKTSDDSIDNYTEVDKTLEELDRDNLVNEIIKKSLNKTESSLNGLKNKFNKI